MPTANDFPTIAEFKVVSSIGSVTFAVEFDDPHFPGGLPYLQTEVFEFYLSDTDDFNSATKAAQGLESAKAEGLAAGAAKYAWLRPRRKSTNEEGTVYTYGPVYPGTGGGINDPGTPGSGVEVTVHSDNEAWVEFTPEVTAQSGTLTSVSSEGGRYKRRGRSVIVQASAIIDNGTGADGIVFSAPVLIANPGPSALYMGIGRIDNLFGDTCRVEAQINVGVHQLLVVRYDGSHPITGSATLVIQIEYETDS